jgi:hypothetical protein
MMIAYDKAKCVTIDDETGDYLKVVQSHYSIEETTMALYNKAGRALLVAELIDAGSDVIDTPAGQLLIKKCTLTKAFVPTKTYPPTNFEVPQNLIDRLVIFLRREAETHFNWAAPPQFEFIDARTNIEGAK